MGCEIKVYKKRWDKSTVQAHLDTAEMCLERNKMEMVALAAMTPVQTEAGDVHEEIVLKVNELFDLMEDTIVDRFLMTTAIENEDTEWDDE